MDPGWTQLLVAFVGGSLMTALITAFMKHCLVHPVISVCLDEKRGSYGPMEVICRDKEGNETGRYPARFLRLHVENTGRATIKGCSGYITKMTKHTPGIKNISEREVIDLFWSNKDTATRDIPPGAFFHMSIAALDLKPTGRELHIAHRKLPTSLIPFFSGGGAAYEFEILIAADNARPRRIRVEFTHDPGSDDLGFKPLDKARYPWWAVWKWRLLRSRR